jgi:REP element-mobilizing transposase RayT
VSHQRESIFGLVENGEVILSAIGKIVAGEWLRSADIRQEIELDDFVIMPNHLHAIVAIVDDTTSVGAHGRAPLRAGDSPTYRPPRSIGSLVAGFKSSATRRINDLRSMPGVPVWQRNYHDRIIRDEQELNRIRQYIIDNPAKWDEDPENAGRALPTYEA